MTNREKYDSIISKVNNRQITIDRAMELLGELYVTVVFDGDDTISPNEIDYNAIRLSIVGDAEKMKAKMPERVERRRRIW